jgi:hypothetical protein
MTEYYHLSIPKTDGYSIVSFIQVPNSEPGVNCNTIAASVVDTKPQALGESLGELLTTSIGVLERQPVKGQSAMRYARFYHISGEMKVVGEEKELPFVTFTDARDYDKVPTPEEGGS